MELVYCKSLASTDNSEYVMDCIIVTNQIILRNVNELKVTSKLLILQSCTKLYINYIPGRNGS